MQRPPPHVQQHGRRARSYLRGKCTTTSKKRRYWTRIATLPPPCHSERPSRPEGTRSSAFATVAEGTSTPPRNFPHAQIRKHMLVRKRKGRPVKNTETWHVMRRHQANVREPHLAKLEIKTQPPSCVRQHGREAKTSKSRNELNGNGRQRPPPPPPRLITYSHLPPLATEGCSDNSGKSRKLTAPPQ